MAGPTGPNEFGPAAYQELQFMMESLDLGFWRFCLASNSLEWDTGVYRRYGVTRDQFPTPFDFWSQCLTEESLDTARREMQLALTGEKEYHATYELKLPNGETRFVLARAKLIRGADGRPSHLYGINIDITAQAIAESENRKLLLRLSEAQSIAQIGSWTLDIASRKIDWTSEMYRILEIPEPQPADQLYALYRSRMRPADQEHLDRMMAQAIETGQGYEFHRTLHFGEGRVKHIEGICRVTRGENGKSVRISGTCRDRTREVELQRKLDLERAKSDRNARLAALGELSAGLAHEVNNPLAIIDGNARILSTFGTDPESLTPGINSILNACQRISKIVGGLKKFSRTGETAFFEEHRPGEIMKEALELIEAKANYRGAALDLSLETDSPILCDRLQVLQVLINLLNNAIDATESGSEKWVKMTAADESSFVVIRVSDSGCKISKDVQEKLFVPFFTTKEIGVGTGLGLSISRGIVEDHGGSIAFLEDAPNTCFEIRLPRAGGQA